MNTYTLYWRTGKRETVKGDDPAQAMTLAGFEQRCSKRLLKCNEPGAAAVTKEKDMADDTRYPYTYAADYVRSSAPGKLSRSDASQIRSAIALAIGIDDAELARKLADYYKANEAAITEKCVAAVMAQP